MKHLIKKYTEFIKEGYNDPPDDPETFVEVYEDDLIFFEEKMKTEGMNINSKTFYEIIDKLGVEADYEKDLMSFTSEYYNKTYAVGNTEFDEYLQSHGEELSYSLEYKKVRDSVPTVYRTQVVKRPDQKGFTKKLTDYRATEKAQRSALFRHLVEKNWDEYKTIYQKWIDYIHEHRGEISGINYGV